MTMTIESRSEAPGERDPEPILTFDPSGLNISSSVIFVTDVSPEKMLISDDTSCGLGFLRSPCLQRFANEYTFAFFYGILCCAITGAFSYYSCTISTVEKRFRISSKMSGFIATGSHIAPIFGTIIMSYYAGRGHTPRWIAFTVYVTLLFCGLALLPHVVYGPGSEAHLLTKEYSTQISNKSSENNESLCLRREHGKADCDKLDGDLAPQLMLFIGQLLGGIGTCIYYPMGYVYMDNNIQKSKIPAFVGFAYFLRTLGPAFGYALASFTLKIYINPTVSPTISTSDPRWLGAWWIGWIILALLLFSSATVIAFFPKILPTAAARKALKRKQFQLNSHHINLDYATEQDNIEQCTVAAMKTILETFKRLFINKALIFNTLSTILGFTATMAYWTFLPKYIEIQYKQSPSVSSLYAGLVTVPFSALGVLVSGLIVTISKPRPRYVAAWNVVASVVAVMAMTSYAFLGCSTNGSKIEPNSNVSLDTKLLCNHCDCEYVSPGTRFTSCYASCQSYQGNYDDTESYLICSCQHHYPSEFLSEGECSEDCVMVLYLFLAIMSVMQFCFATSTSSNFFVFMRCVEEKDKPVAVGFAWVMLTIFSFAPSPILFGFIMDQTCLIWGSTCFETGNCWLYNEEHLRYLLNFTAAGIGIIGTIFKIGVFHFMKDVKMFDDQMETES